MPRPAPARVTWHLPPRLTWYAVLAALCVALLLLCAPRSIAQPTRADAWTRLIRAAPAGTPVRVTLIGGRTTTGHVATITPDVLTLQTAGGMAAHAADEIARVVRSDARRRRVLRYGLPIGALTGGLILLALDAASNNPEPGQAFGMGAVLVGAPAGTAIAAVWPVRPLYEER